MIRQQLPGYGMLDLSAIPDDLRLVVFDNCLVPIERGMRHIHLFVNAGRKHVAFIPVIERRQVAASYNIADPER